MLVDTCNMLYVLAHSESSHELTKPNTESVSLQLT